MSEQEQLTIQTQIGRLYCRYKAQENARHREHEPLAKLQGRLKAAGPTRDFIGALKAAFERTGKPGLIAEVKKASPSKGVICANFDPVRVHF